MTSVAVINGPNLNLLGRHGPGIYGHTTLAALESMYAAERRSVG